MRKTCQKHQEWWDHLWMIKIDLMKAFDTLVWGAMDDMFVERGMPADLRTACWRLHARHTLTFRTADGAFTFPATPRHGIPQGEPESTSVHVAVVEWLLGKAETGW